MRKINYFSVLLITTILLSCEKKSELDNINKYDNSNEYSIDGTSVEQIAMNALEEFSDCNLKSSNNYVEFIEPIKNSNNNINMYQASYANGGFVIISNSKNEVPVLAYSNETNLENLKDCPSFQWWLSKKNHIIDSLNIYDETDTLKRNFKNARWNKFTNNSLKVGTIGAEFIYDEVKAEPMLSSEWGQDYPYNIKCPELSQCDDDLPVTGCGPIAMAQVLRYYKLPTTYNWDIIPNRLRSTSSTESINETARLIANVCKKLGMSKTTFNYGCKSSWSLPNNLEGAFESLGYSHSANRKKASDIPLGIVQKNLRERHPVIMDAAQNEILGIQSKGWHIFILDGYREQKYIISFRVPHTGEEVSRPYYYQYFSINWGWYGRNSSETPDYLDTTPSYYNAENTYNKGRGWFSLDGISYDECVHFLYNIYPE